MNSIRSPVLCVRAGLVARSNAEKSDLVRREPHTASGDKYVLTMEFDEVTIYADRVQRAIFSYSTAATHSFRLLWRCCLPPASPASRFAHSNVGTQFLAPLSSTRIRQSLSGVLFPRECFSFITSFLRSRRRGPFFAFRTNCARDGDFFSRRSLCPSRFSFCLSSSSAFHRNH